MVLQNAVFTRGLGSSRSTLMMNSPRRILFFGTFLTFISSISAMAAWPLNFLLRKYQVASRLGVRYSSSLVTLLCICGVFALSLLLARAYFPRLHYRLRDVAIPAAFNCAVLGSILIAFGSGFSFWGTLGFAFGSGVGYALALLLISEGRKRIALSEVPRAFRGMPVMLLYVGILSLAIYGLIGHQLPT